ncbi:MAG: hypothetical protein ACLGI2_00075 [Acidimicrobiia bacterium]|jgi:hypothetical protein
MIRPPWSKRQNDHEIANFFVLREGVPDGLLTSLTEFVVSVFYVHDEFMGGFQPNREVINHFARITDHYLPGYPDDAVQQFQEDRELLLDAVDFAVGRLNPESYRTTEIVAKLTLQLAEARSAYVLGRDGAGQWELQHRQPEGLTALVAEATSGTDRASEHLRRSWSKAFGRSPDPNGACVEAVAAIEVAARPVVSPTNMRATLGTMIRDMKAKPSKWSTHSEADEDIETVISMMDMVWTGHYRHGNDSKPIDVTNVGAEMIVPVAALLVHWFKAGRIMAVRT